MRSFFFAAAAILLTSTIAYADDVMASRYGNTTITTDASGVQTRIYYNADGTFTGKQGDQNFTGTWKLDGSGQICMTYVPAYPGTTNPICYAAIAHQVGDSWSAAGRSMTLVKGIQ
jgi:hypothetical protein